MKIITTIPIYRNNFQKPLIFFSNFGFSIGSIILIPFSKTEKPAIIIDISDLKESKFFLRKNKIDIKNIDNPFELKFLSKEIVENLYKWSKKLNKPIEEVFKKTIPKKTTKTLNNIRRSNLRQNLWRSNLRQLKAEHSEVRLKQEVDENNIQKIRKSINLEFINKKLQPAHRQIGNIIQKKETKTKKPREIKTIQSILSQKKPKKSSLHSEKHYLVDEIRNYFGEKESKGKGSFSFYLGFFKRIPEATIYQYWSEVKESRKSIKDQQKIFWWKIGQYLKNKNQK